MNDRHIFYGIELSRLKKIFGSKDERFIEEILLERAQDFQNNDSYFSDDIQFDRFDSETALREIVAGSIRSRQYSEKMFARVLKVICKQIGEFLGEAIAIRDHPYKSKLLASGVPIPIPHVPYDPYQFSNNLEIGFLDWKDIPGEIQRIEQAPQRAKPSYVLELLSWFRPGLVGRIMNQLSGPSLVKDMQDYKDVLMRAHNKGLSVVSICDFEP